MKFIDRAKELLNGVVDLRNSVPEDVVVATNSPKELYANEDSFNLRVAWSNKVRGLAKKAREYDFTMIANQLETINKSCITGKKDLIQLAMLGIVRTLSGVVASLIERTGNIDG